MLKQLIATFALACAATGAMASVEINQATEAELDAVKGLGPATTRLIVGERQKSRFKDWSDFMGRVKGMREKRAAKLSAQGVTVAGASYVAPAVAPTSKKK